VIGGTPLFRLVRAERAPQMFYRLGVAGILVRHFPDQPGLLRFGLPGPERDWERLRLAAARMR
jgi:cobalamin biosynthetic protein CobC